MHQSRHVSDLYSLSCVFFIFEIIRIWKKFITKWKTGNRHFAMRNMPRIISPVIMYFDELVVHLSSIINRHSTIGLTTSCLFDNWWCSRWQFLSQNNNIFRFNECRLVANLRNNSLCQHIPPQFLQCQGGVTVGEVYDSWLRWMLHTT